MAAGTRVLRTTPAAAGGDPSPAGLWWLVDIE
jgi:hypothetical protein